MLCARFRYGDIAATPHNPAEQIACTCLISLGGVLWGYVVGVFVGTIASLSPATSDFRASMDNLNAYMAENEFTPSLRARLREYFHRTRHLADAPKQRQLLTMMSPMLQSEVVLAANSRWLRSVWFLKHAEAELIVTLTLAFSPMVLAPFELAPPGFLYVLNAGVVVVDGGVFTRGRTWGEDLILACVAPNLCRSTAAKALNYAEVYICSWDALAAALDGFPTSAVHVRRCAVRLAMCRNLVLAAEQVKAQQRRDGRQGAGTGGGVLVGAGSYESSSFVRKHPSKLPGVGGVGSGGGKGERTEGSFKRSTAASFRKVKAMATTTRLLRRSVEVSQAQRSLSSKQIQLRLDPDSTGGGSSSNVLKLERKPSGGAGGSTSSLGTSPAAAKTPSSTPLDKSEGSSPRRASVLFSGLVDACATRGSAAAVDASTVGVGASEGARLLENLPQLEDAMLEKLAERIAALREGRDAAPAVGHN